MDVPAVVGREWAAGAGGAESRLVASILAIRDASEKRFCTKCVVAAGFSPRLRGLKPAATRCQRQDVSDKGSTERGKLCAWRGLRRVVCVESARIGSRDRDGECRRSIQSRKTVGTDADPLPREDEPCSAACPSSPCWPSAVART